MIPAAQVTCLADQMAEDTSPRSRVSSAITEQSSGASPP
jgi:hypothetical protein